MRKHDPAFSSMGIELPDRAHELGLLPQPLRRRQGGTSMAIHKVDRNRGMIGRRSILVAAIAAVVLAAAPRAPAATITVDSLADTGAPGICVLRDAIIAANTKVATNGCATGTGNDVITFSVTGLIVLASTLPLNYHQRTHDHCPK
jgi:hypothetical protein